MSSLIMFTFTSMTIYVQLPRFFLMRRTSPTITLTLKFSMIWKLPHIVLIKIRQIISSGWRDILSRLFWNGQICWTVVWRWVPMYCGFTFLTQLHRVWLLLFQTLFWRNESVIWQTKSIGKRQEKMTYINYNIQVSAFSWLHSTGSYFLRTC